MTVIQFYATVYLFLPFFFFFFSNFPAAFHFCCCFSFLNLTGSPWSPSQRSAALTSLAPMCNPPSQAGPREAELGGHSCWQALLLAGGSCEVRTEG